MIFFNQGEMPLPPYLKNPTPKISDKYQTVYAKKEGSVAAPTAGFHFTPQLLNQLRKKGVQFEEITLHVWVRNIFTSKRTASGNS